MITHVLQDKLKSNQYNQIMETHVPIVLWTGAIDRNIEAKQVKKKKRIESLVQT